jgi:hypothetical protein
MGITAEFERLKKSSGRIPIHRDTRSGYLTPIFRRKGFTFELLKNQSKYQ